MEGAAQKDLEQRLGAAHRQVPADSSAGVSVTGLTEHSADYYCEMGIGEPWHHKRLKRKASATSTSMGGSKSDPSSVDHVQSGHTQASGWTETKVAEPLTRSVVSILGPFANIVIHFTRKDNTSRQDIIRMGDIPDQSTHLPSWKQLVNILKTGGKFGLDFKDGSEYIVVNSQINIHEERQFLACLQYLRNANILNAEAAVCSTGQFEVTL